MTKTITDVKIGTRNTIDMPRHKLQIDTRITGEAIPEIAKQEADALGVTYREYILLAIHKGAKSPALRNIVFQELGAHAEYLVKRYGIL